MTSSSENPSCHSFWSTLVHSTTWAPSERWILPACQYVPVNSCLQEQEIGKEIALYILESTEKPKGKEAGGFVFSLPCFQGHSTEINRFTNWQTTEMCSLDSWNHQYADQAVHIIMIWSKAHWWVFQNRYIMVYLANISDFRTWFQAPLVQSLNSPLERPSCDPPVRVKTVCARDNIRQHVWKPPWLLCAHCSTTPFQVWQHLL